MPQPETTADFDHIMADPATTAALTGVSGQITAYTLTDRIPAHIIVSKVAAVIAIFDGGPARFVFGEGGYLDVCGDAEYWRRQIRLSELGQSTNG